MAVGKARQPSRSSGSYRVDQRRERDARQRRVRRTGRGVGTSAQGSAPRGRIVATTKPQRRRRRRSPLRRARSTFGKMRRGGPITMLWSAATLLVGTAALVVQTSTWLIFTLTSLGVTTLVGVVETRRRPHQCTTAAEKSGERARPWRIRRTGDRQWITGSQAHGTPAEQGPRMLRGLQALPQAQDARELHVQGAGLRARIESRTAVTELLWSMPPEMRLAVIAVGVLAAAAILAEIGIPPFLAGALALAVATGNGWDRGLAIAAAIAVTLAAYMLWCVVKPRTKCLPKPIGCGGNPKKGDGFGNWSNCLWCGGSGQRKRAGSKVLRRHRRFIGLGDDD